LRLSTTVSLHTTKKSYPLIIVTESGEILHMVKQEVAA
jgi:hypothetical protein